MHVATKDDVATVEVASGKSEDVVRYEEVDATCHVSYVLSLHKSSAVRRRCTCSWAFYHAS